MSRQYPLGACWCPRCNQPGNPVDEDTPRDTDAPSPDAWGDVA